MDKAVHYLEQALAIAPEHPQVLNMFGTQMIMQGEFARARDLIARAAAADPREPILWLNLARAYRELGDTEGERESLDKALALDARHFIGLMRKAHLLQRTGKNAAAAATWLQALAMAPPPGQRTAEMEHLLTQGEAFAHEHAAKFGAQIDELMAPVRAVLDPKALRRTDATIDALLGRRQVYANQCAGMHVPFLPADEFFDRDFFPWFAELEAATPAIRAEFLDLLEKGDEGFAPYVQNPSGMPQNIWSELDHSERWSAYFLWKFGKRIDAHCARCPKTAETVEKLPLADQHNRAPTVFFSLLHPKTRIPPHTGVTNARTIIHLGLVIPEGCGFRVGGETREWREGEAFAFDDTIEHEAWNDSDQLRAVLIFDIWNPHLQQHERDVLNAFLAAADSTGQNPFVDREE